MALSKFSEAKTLCLRLLIVKGVCHFTPKTRKHYINDGQTMTKMILGKNIIEEHYINDGETMTR